MALPVVISEVAERDLESTWVYVAERNYDAADKLLDEILAVTEKLATWPEMGRVRPDLQPGVWSFPVDNYVIFYRVGSDVIEVARVLHGRRDIDSMF